MIYDENILFPENHGENCKQNGKTVGAIGVIGPTRMNYKKVISMIDGIAGGVSDVLSEGAPPLPEITAGGSNGEH